MSDYLKMADVFKGVVICSHTDDEAVQELQKGDSAGSNFHLEDDGYWLATTEEHIKYAAHAINEHDELVSKLEITGQALIDSCSDVAKLKKEVERLSSINAELLNAIDDSVSSGDVNAVMVMRKKYITD
ncbi:MAG: hypothetical protein ACRC8W_04705 [Plesiomonas shigelloides]